MNVIANGNVIIGDMIVATHFNYFFCYCGFFAGGNVVVVAVIHVNQIVIFDSSSL